MLKIRLQRVGRKNDPSFRVVVTESTRGPKSGRMVEALGFHNPREKGSTHFVSERILHWISQGAQVSTTVHNLLVDQKILNAKKRNALPRKSPIVKGAAHDAVKETKDTPPQPPAEISTETSVSSEPSTAEEATLAETVSA